MRFLSVSVRHIALIGAAAISLSGCATNCCVGVPPAPVVATPTKIQAVGYGSQASYTQYTSGQQKLMAMRAAEVDAYRKLAERVHGFRVTGSTAVSAFATQNDTVRSYVDSFIRGARIVGVVAIADGNYEATVELEMTPQFMSCVRNFHYNCNNYFPGYGGYTHGFWGDSYATGCTVAGCSPSSATFVSY